MSTIREKDCPDCEGSGQVGMTTAGTPGLPLVCRRCEGKGKVCQHGIGFGADDTCVACDTDQQEQDDADGPSRDVDYAANWPARPFLITDKDYPERYKP